MIQYNFAISLPDVSNSNSEIGKKKELWDIKMRHCDWLNFSWFNENELELELESKCTYMTNMSLLFQHGLGMVALIVFT